MKILLKAGLLHGDCMTITGRTMAELETSMANLCAAGLVEPG